MEQTLLAFVTTLDATFKRLLVEIGAAEGLARLTISQFQYIDAVHRLGEPTITELAENLGVSKAAVTVGINKLVALGYATKARSDRDRRLLHVRLAPAGERLIDARSEALRSYVAELRRALGEAEARQFERTLDRLVQRTGPAAAGKRHETSSST